MLQHAHQQYMGAQLEVVKKDQEISTLTEMLVNVRRELEAAQKVAQLNPTQM